MFCSQRDQSARTCFSSVKRSSTECGKRIVYAREPSKLPTVLSADEVVRFPRASIGWPKSPDLRVRFSNDAGARTQTDVTECHELCFTRQLSVEPALPPDL
jgi:hypothetical protein